jgi:hypothetical protein
MRIYHKCTLQCNCNQRKADSDDFLYLGTYQDELLSNEASDFGSIVISDPIPIEQLLLSGNVASFDIETQNAIEEKLSDRQKRIDNASLFCNAEYTIEIVDFSFNTDEKIEVQIISNEEILLEEYDYLFVNDDIAAKERSSIIRLSSNSNCDLYVKDLYNSNGTQPFLIAAPYNFTFTIGNNGLLDAVGVACTVYLDNDYAGAINVGTIPAYVSGTITIAVTVGNGGYGGARTLKISAGTLTPDLNKSNNQKTGAFIWRKNVDMASINLQNNTSGNNPLMRLLPKFIALLLLIMA